LPLTVARNHFVFNLDSPVAPRQRNQNFSSAILRASGDRPSKEAPGISASVNSEAINRNEMYIHNNNYSLVGPNEMADKWYPWFLRSGHGFAKRLLRGWFPNYLNIL